ncbi:MAG: hypothetical protein WCS97_01210 [Candidatus Paceibacterota bacterium]
MITPELQTYIRQQLGAGIAKDVIKQNLSAKGWNVQDLDDAFFAIESEHTAQAATPPAASRSHKGMWATVIILILLLLGAGGAYAAYSYGLITLPSLTTTTTPTVATTTQAYEDQITPGGNNAGPSCQYDTPASCRNLEVTCKIELSDSIKNSTYIFHPETANDQNGWYDSKYSFADENISNARFLGIADSLVTKKLYNKLFPSNAISSTTPTQNFSVHCSDDKTVLPTANSRFCYGNDLQENKYLFNARGERLTTVYELHKNLITTYSACPNDVSSLETIKNIKDSTTLVFDQGHIYISATSTLQKIEVIYSGIIASSTLTSDKKLQEISIFEDGSTKEINF